MLVGRSAHRKSMLDLVNVAVARTSCRWYSSPSMMAAESAGNRGRSATINPALGHVHHSRDGLWRVPRVLVTGALGQMGSDLVSSLRERYGDENVVATDIIRKPSSFPSGPFAHVDVTDKEDFERVIVEHNINWIVHNASVLSSAGGEYNPQYALTLKTRGAQNLLQLAKTHSLRVFAPSTIAAFGASTPVPEAGTPDETIQRPISMYGIANVHLELLGNYYHKSAGVDFRCVRYPGIVSATKLPRGGTTDFAAQMLFAAFNVKMGLVSSDEAFVCSMIPDVTLPFAYVGDVVRGCIHLLESPSTELSRRVYNIQGISFSPSDLEKAIQAVEVPDFKVRYAPKEDYSTQIALSWPRSVDDSAARHDFGWAPIYDLPMLVQHVMAVLESKMESGESFELPARQNKLRKPKP